MAVDCNQHPVRIFLVSSIATAPCSVLSLSDEDRTQYVSETRRSLADVACHTAIAHNDRPDRMVGYRAYRVARRVLLSRLYLLCLKTPDTTLTDV